MIDYFKRHIFWKFFFSYFLFVLVVMLVLGIALRILLPGAFNNHLLSMASLFSRHGIQDMSDMMGGSGPMMMDTSRLFSDLFNIFNQIILEAALYAIFPSIVITLGVSALMSQRFVLPLHKMAKAADQISMGNYKEKLPVGEKRPEGRDELDRLAVRFNNMAAHLKNLEDSRVQMIGDIAHELRTPLTVIKGAMEGLIDGVLKPEITNFEMVYRQAERLDRLVDDLQELNRIEIGGMELYPVPLEVTPVLRKIVDTYKLEFSRKEVDLTFSGSEKDLLILADNDRIEQIVINLLNNALRFTPPGGKVRVSIGSLEDFVQISVKDTGVGIPDEDLERIFNRFYRVDGSRSRQDGGSGIGLTIAKKLVEAHGGKIWAESDGLNKGAVFKFTLPKID